MDVLSPFPAVACLATALATSYTLMWRFGAPSAANRTTTIDGLRGYLAFFVFLHHASIWYFYLHTGKWVVPPSNLYTHFGQSSVALFFMITGFLFYQKLLKAGERKIDWLHLYASRILRLGPLYALAMTALVGVVAVMSKGTLHESAWTIAKELIRWSSFTILGAPPINGVANAWIVIAGVTWSLPYEWFFYLSLPVLAVFAGNRPSSVALIVGAAGLLALIAWGPSAILLAPFAGGIVAAYLVNHAVFRSVATHWIGSLLALVCIVATVVLFDSPYAVPPLMLLSVAFALLASGADLFGILVRPVSRMLGEQTYSIYLLHGILLFITMNFVIGISNASRLTPMAFWGCLLALTPVLVGISYATFRLVETPGLRMTASLTGAMRAAASIIASKTRPGDRVAIPTKPALRSVDPVFEP